MKERLTIPKQPVGCQQWLEKELACLPTMDEQAAALKKLMESPTERTLFIQQVSGMASYAAERKATPKDLQVAACAVSLMQCFSHYVMKLVDPDVCEEP